MTCINSLNTIFLFRHYSLMQSLRSPYFSFFIRYIIFTYVSVHTSVPDLSSISISNYNVQQSSFFGSRIVFYYLVKRGI
jgi:hypothetical protein